MDSCRAANDKEMEDRVEDFRPVFFDNKPRIIGNIKFFAHREAVVEVEVVGRRYCYGQSEISMENWQSLL